MTPVDRNGLAAKQVGTGGRQSNASPGRGRDDWGDSQFLEDQAREPVKVLTPDEARALVGRYRPLTPQHVLAAQVGAGLVVAAIFGGLTQRVAPFWSALYGAAVVVLPGALMAFALRRRQAGPVAGSQLSLLMWAIVKLMVATAMLALATRVVRDMHWPALLVALAVCLKVNAGALLWQGRVKNTVNG